MVCYFYYFDYFDSTLTMVVIGEFGGKETILDKEWELYM
jgi:hypothetical protein